MNFKPVSLAELYAEIGGGIRFNQEEVVAMMDNSESHGEGLQIIHNDFGYVIPIDSIREYFSSHPRPPRKMSKDEEISFLKRRLEEFEKSAGKAEQLSMKAELPPVAPKVDVETAPADDVVPSREQREKDRKSVDEIQRDIARDLKGAPSDNLRKIKPKSGQGLISDTV